MGSKHSGTVSLIASIVLGGLLTVGCASKNQLNQPVSNITTASIVHENPDVEAADARVEQALASRDRANVDLLPDLNLGMDLTNNSSSASSRSNTANASSNHLSLSIPISDVLTNVRLANGAEAGISAAVSGYNGTMQSALLATVDSEADTLQTAAVVRERQIELRDLQAFHSVSKKRQIAGLISKADLHQISLSVANSRASLSVSVAERDAALARSNALRGGKPGIDVGISKLQSHIPTSQQEALSTALQNNPQLEEFAWRLTEAKHKVEATRYKYLPKAVVSVSGNQYLNDNQSNNDTDVNFKFSLNIPLKSSLATRSEIRVEKAKYKEIDRLGRASTRDVSVQTEVAWRNYIAAKEAARLYEQSVAAAQLAFAGVRKANAIGAKLPADQLDARSDLTQAKINLINARFRRLKQAHALLAHMGVISNAYGLDRMAYVNSPARNSRHNDAATLNRSR